MVDYNKIIEKCCINSLDICNVGVCGTDRLCCSESISLFSNLQLLQQNLETNFYSGQVSWDDVSPNDAAALLKKFIRELPAPLLTPEYLNTFSAVRGQCAQQARPLIDHTVYQDADGCVYMSDFIVLVFSYPASCIFTL